MLSMRRSEKAVTSIGELEQILWQGKVCQLAIPDQPVPYLVPLNYGYHNQALYFHSAAEGHKIELLKNNPLVSFSVVIDLGVIEAEQACHWGARFRSVIGTGRVGLCEAVVVKHEALQLLMEQYSDKEFTLPEEAIKATTVFKLTIEQMVGKQSRV